MIPKKPALGLDPRVGTGFRIRSCSNKNSGLRSDSIELDRSPERRAGTERIDHDTHIRGNADRAAGALHFRRRAVAGAAGAGRWRRRIAGLAPQPRTDGRSPHRRLLSGDLLDLGDDFFAHAGAVLSYFLALYRRQHLLARTVDRRLSSVPDPYLVGGARRL